MKTCLDKAVVIALAAAIFCAPSGLSAEDEKSEGCNYFGIKGGLNEPEADYATLAGILWRF